MTKAQASNEKARHVRETPSINENFGLGKSRSVYLVRIGPKRLKPFSQIWEAWPQTRKLKSARQLVDCFRAAEPRSIWLSSDAMSLRALAEEMPAARGEHRVLVFEDIADSTRQVLSAYFRYVLTAEDSLSLLDPPELIEVLSSNRKEDLFIGGTVDRKEQAVVLYRGSLDPLVVPLAWFSAGKNSPAADPCRFSIEDTGQTIRLGDFEAASDAILYEFDPVYRTRQRKEALKSDNSFGASLRRLRLQKGLTRDDFTGVAPKTIARIERNEIKKPHQETLTILATRLGVSPEKLGTY